MKKAASAAKSQSTSSKKKTAAVYPTVASISPRKIAIGQKLTIKGTHFRAGKGKSSVAFYKSGKAVIFVPADSATTSKLVVTVPAKVASLLAQKDGSAAPTLLRLRVIGAKMGRAWTQNSRSPIVSPLPPAPSVQGAAPLTQQQVAAQQYLTCQQTAAANPAGDQDADGITNGTELANRLDACNADTDGDTLTDGYEFWSAIDLNGYALPYPGKRPWPNPLDPTDINYDFDGDGLQLWQEFALWKTSNSGFPLTQYSDGNQNTGGTQPVITQAQRYLDLDKDGNLTDDERDFDGDGLSNMTEYNNRGTQDWWRAIAWYEQPNGDGTNHSYVEPWYYLRAFSDLDPTDPDSDGDRVLDGADDQDNDGWSNFAEMQLSRAEVGYRVHPFNPCLPDPHSRVCSRWLPLSGAAWAPFDVVRTDPVTHAPIYSAMPGDAIPFGWPQVTYATWLGAGAPDQYTGSVFGPWDPTPWFTEAWDGTTGPQGA
ncbi:IPT/TIG domain-containing protein [Baekduia alba]|uniref:IPT/TIG domain-containing protein n=1 Tax=Baekduia alba TaxID=2997333 RepID=UPI0023402413|nr:IPT/TIG domain-containing protein [Baekduia alba]